MSIVMITLTRGSGRRGSPSSKRRPLSSFLLVVVACCSRCVMQGNLVPYRLLLFNWSMLVVLCRWSIMDDDVLCAGQC